MNRRVKISIMGAVQGVGFRPFIYRLAKEMSIKGFVQNNLQGVLIEAEAGYEILQKFILCIEKEKPPRAIITSFEYSFFDAINYSDFQIIKSKIEGKLTALIQPDISVCADCLRELFDVKDRRFLYPFINCTNCGPRYSIIESLPYDRPNTSMKNFQMCDECQAEYDNPNDRRYHAQPIACPKCGPEIQLLGQDKNILATGLDALKMCISKMLQGKIIAFKGVGGFQLICIANDDKAVSKLRRRKLREEKPFAVMFPDIKMVTEVCEVLDLEERALISPEAPIVLLKKRKSLISSAQISEFVSPQNPYLGVMLPSSPLHHLLMKEINIPIVATSGNLSEEPICIDNDEASERLKNIADYFLIHNRGIVRHVDDSIVKIILGRETILRRARGYAPLPISVSLASNKNFSAVGAHLKNNISVSKENNIFISQHIGDLSTKESLNAFERTTSDLQRLFEIETPVYISDMHPEYISTKYAKQISANVYQVQHHIAHAAGCIAENNVDGDALAIVWDGTGFGLDGSIWGGEFFTIKKNNFIHSAQLKQFYLPGGDTSIKEPRRTAAGLLFSLEDKALLQLHLNNHFTQDEQKIISEMLEKKINTHLTSSVGRLFDAVGSILNIKQKNNFEGEAAMSLEFVCDSDELGKYSFNLTEGKLLLIDWSVMIKEIIYDLESSVPQGIIASKFHSTLVEMMLAVAQKINISKILLSGGCFQNTVLLERSVRKLENSGFKVYWHQRVPTNDGGISFGQICYAMMKEGLDD